MTTQDLFQLPTNRATVKKLSAMCREDDYLNASLFSSIIGSINDYLSLPVVVKRIVTKPTTESIYNGIMKAKANGYRKEVKELV